MTTFMLLSSSHYRSTAPVLLLAITVLTLVIGQRVAAATVATRGTALGDPAPGRSPGPPTSTLAVAASTVAMTTVMSVAVTTTTTATSGSTGTTMIAVSPSAHLVATSEAVSWTGCSLDGGAIVPGEEADGVEVSVEHELFSTRTLVRNIPYNVAISQKERASGSLDFSLTCLVDGQTVGAFASLSSSDDDCQHTYRGKLDQTIATTSRVSWRFSERGENWQQQSTSPFDGVGGGFNMTFVLRYRFSVNPDTLYEKYYVLPIAEDCQLWLHKDAANVTQAHIPPQTDCRLWFPSHHSVTSAPAGHGLVVDLHRLNVPCTRGHLQFLSLNVTGHLRNKHAHLLCGKLEELPDGDRHIYFPASVPGPYVIVHGAPIFQITYRLVDYCYNVSFTGRNGTFTLKPTSDLECTFKILLPYGNRIALTLEIGDSTSTGVPVLTDTSAATDVGEDACRGLYTEFVDGETRWSHCARAGDADRRLETVSHGNRLVLRVMVRAGAAGTGGLGLRLDYGALPQVEVVGMCSFGWVAVRQFCVTAVEAMRLNWVQAEQECGRKGGHLASVRNEHAQDVIDKLLFNSPGNKDHNAYWIGASDERHEGDFHWTDGLPFSFTNWFPGWSQHGDYNKQPNDDGLSEQDCVEVRRMYALPSSTSSVANTYMWNDRDCDTLNYFICERLQNNEPLEDNWPPDCNRSVVLSRQQPRSAVSSPGFPRLYPDNANCETHITAPPGYRIVLDFEELVIENEPICSYDYLEIIEHEINHTSSPTSLPPTAPSSSSSSSSAVEWGGSSASAGRRRVCGDWSSKLKLLRHVSHGSKIRLRFTSDYSHHYGGFKARVSMESATECSDDRLQMFNHSCYLFVSYPEVTWHTAQQICHGIRAHLSSILSADEERFITTNIRKMSEYRTSARYWLGSQANAKGEYAWTDEASMSYEGWLPGHVTTSRERHLCLGIQWMPSPTPMLPSGLYWRAQKCDQVGGYVCKRQLAMPRDGVINFNKTINGSEGVVATPNYPSNYYNNLDFIVKIVAPERTRIVIQFERIDMEAQLECLYDYIEVRSTIKVDRKKLCGLHDSDMDRFNFVSASNEVEIVFHSDYSLTGSGFALSWKAVDVSACPSHTLTAKEDTITSPNYPHFLLAGLECTFTILASPGKRIWLQFEDFDLARPNVEMDNDIREEAMLQLVLGKTTPEIRPFQVVDLISDGGFVSESDRMIVRMTTNDRPRGRGFRAVYRAIPAPAYISRSIMLSNMSSGALLHVNYPARMPRGVQYTQHLVAPLGHTISLDMYHVQPTEGTDCDEHNVIEVFDNYADNNGSSWRLCHDSNELESVVPHAPIAITSFLNTLYVRQRSSITGSATNGLFLNATLRVHHDLNVRAKLLQYRADTVEACNPNPCMNGGKCVSNGSQKFCQCLTYYTGLFCTLTQCDLEPCLFGTCELTNTSYRCHCDSGYMGSLCAQKRRPCETNPCESRGICLEKGDTFVCQCHAWWKGNRCQDRMVHIPYKPLSERMLREPFWLGLMTVSVVMGVIGLFWCAKRHFPEKIEKLLAEEDDRNRISSLRSSSVRDQLAASGGSSATAQLTPGGSQSTTGGGAPPPPRTLFGRLGIRKPSLLSLTSPHAAVAVGLSGGYSPATARTFSLDDLLKPVPRRTPSPKKKRNNSTPSKKNAAEKKQILQQLIGSSGKQNSRKVSLGELIQMTDGVDGVLSTDACGILETTRFSCELAIAAAAVTSAQISLTDPKLEKKVTFARQQNKSTHELSSGASSDLELGIMHTNRLSCAFAPRGKSISTPSSPGGRRTDADIGAGATVRVDAGTGGTDIAAGGAAAQRSSPNSTSSNQGSDSLTSCSDLPAALSSSISDLIHPPPTHHHHNHHHHHLLNHDSAPNHNHHQQQHASGVGFGRQGSQRAGSNGSMASISSTGGGGGSSSFRQKPGSADSILAMFRNFSSSSAGVNLPSSLRVSPSTTPTASTPQDDLVGDDETSTSSIRTTPISFESPQHYQYQNQQQQQYSQASTSSSSNNNYYYASPTTSSTIEVSVLDTLSAAHKSSQSGGSNFLHPPTILLEIPSTINKCLSPIRELPTPLPSPCVTPYMRRLASAASTSATSPAGTSGPTSSAAAIAVHSSSLEDLDLISDDHISVELSTNISISDGELDDELPHSHPDIVIDPQGEDGLILEEAAAMQHGTNPLTTFTAKPRLPVGQSLSLPIPVINVIDVCSGAAKPGPLMIPTLTIETPSPTRQRPTMLLGSPPPRSPEGCTFQFNTPMMQQPPKSRRMLKEFDKPTSLDLPYAPPPMITITCNLSEVESDVDSLSVSPNKKSIGNHHLGGVNPSSSSSSGMSYLSPFSMVMRGDHMASESNLSSSGYSSMASPGPSRCGSSNPLCPSETEDHPGPSSHHQHPHLSRRPSPLLRLGSNNSSTSNAASTASNTVENQQQQRGRSDSETLSDDPLLESNDEGIGTDHLEEKIDDGELKSAKELEIYICTDAPSKLDVLVDVVVGELDADRRVLAPSPTLLPPSSATKQSLQLPSIVVHSDSNLSKLLSPISSRSESPLSDRTLGLNRFSPQFYGRHKDQLPFTDSDGLYDFPSSDRVNVSSAAGPPRKTMGRKRSQEKKVLGGRNAKTPSPTKSQQSAPGSVYHLDIPAKMTGPTAVRKLSPTKRRSRTLQQQQVLGSSSSSSSDSIVSAREFRLSSSSPSPDVTMRWSASLEWPDNHQKDPITQACHVPRSPEASDEDTADEVHSSMLPKQDQEFPKNRKINKLRAISHQIRFLRRLEMSLKRRDRIVVSPSGSVEDSDGGTGDASLGGAEGGDDSPRASSPLLSRHCHPASSRPDGWPAVPAGAGGDGGSFMDVLRKSQSSGKLQLQTQQPQLSKTRRARLHRSEYLLPEDRYSWNNRRIVITSPMSTTVHSTRRTGHSD